MVGHDATQLLVGAQSKTATNGMRSGNAWRREQRDGSSLRNQGLDAKKNKTSLWTGKCFYLTSPFIEPGLFPPQGFLPLFAAIEGAG